MADKLTQFDYLLNAMERASQADKPAQEGYAAKRAAVIKHVRDLEAQCARVRTEMHVPARLIADLKNAIDTAKAIQTLMIDVGTADDFRRSPFPALRGEPDQAAGAMAGET